MGVEIAAGVIGAVVGMGAINRARMTHLNRVVSRALVEQLDLNITSRASIGTRTVGTIDGLDVVVSTPAVNYVAVEILLLHPLAQGAWIVRHGVAPGPPRLSGDAVFDARFVSGGDPVVVAALLDHANRNALMTDPFKRVTVQHDRVIIDGFWGFRLPEATGAFVAQIRAAVRLARTIVYEGPPKDRVRRHATDDPNWMVRLENLCLIIDESAARRAIDDEDERLRIVGAAYLGAFETVGEDDAIKALRSVHDPRVRDAALIVLASRGTKRALAALRGVPAQARRSSRHWHSTIAAIQERVGSNGVGELSVSDVDSSGVGELSLSEVRPGRPVNLPAEAQDD